MKLNSDQKVGCAFWVVVLIAVGIFNVIRGHNPVRDAGAPGANQAPANTGVQNRSTAVDLDRTDESQNDDGQLDNPVELPSLPRIDLQDAVAQGTVEASVTGRDLSEVSISLKSKIDSAVLVVVPAGTIVRPSSDTLQSMMVVRQCEIPLKGAESLTRGVDVACINMRRGVPHKSDALTLSPGATGDLQKLVQTEAFRQAQSRVRQFAVWTVTDDPARNAYTGIGVYVGTRPSDGEMTVIRSLLASAGIEPDAYRAFNPAPAELRETEAQRKAAAQSDAEDKRRADVEQRRFKTVSTVQSGARMLFKVQLLSNAAEKLTVDQLSELAAKVTDMNEFVVWFYLPDMSVSDPAWAVSTGRGKRQIETKVFPDRRPRKGR